MKGVLKISAILTVVLFGLISGCSKSISTEARMARAQEDLASARYSHALIELKNVLEKEPRNVTALIMFANTELKLGDPQSASLALQAAIKYGASIQQVADVKARVYLAQGKATELIADTELKVTKVQEPLRSLYRGRAYLLLRKYAEAESAFNAALDKDPTSAEGHIGLAELFAAKGQLNEALAQLDLVDSRNPKLASSWLLRAGVYGRRDQYAEMESALRNAQQNAATQLDFTQQAILLDSLTQSRLAQGNIKGAEASYKELQKIAPDVPITQILAGRIALAQNDYVGATAKFKKVVNAAPTLKQVRFLLANSLLAQGELRDAEQQLVTLLQQAPDDLEARKLLAKVKLQLGSPDGAISVLEPAVKSNSADFAVNELLGMAQIGAGRKLIGLALFEKNVKNFPKNRDARLLLATTYMESGLPQKGRASIDQWVAENPKDIETLNQASAFLISHGEFKQAEIVLAQARAVDPTNATTQFNLAKLALGRGDNATAQQLLEKICAADQKAVQPRLMLAQLHLGQRQAANADRVIKELLAAVPGQARVLNSVGQLYFQSGRYADALANFRAATAIESGNSTYWLNVSSAELALDHTQTATEAVAKALLISPNSMAAIRTMVLLEMRANNLEAALNRVVAAREKLSYEAAIWDLEGDVRSALKQYAEAASNYDQASRLRATADVTLKSYQARLVGGLPKITEPLESWLSQHPDDTKVRSVLALAYQTGRRNAEAVREYEAIVSKGSPDAAVLNNLALLYQESGDARAIGTAKRAYEMAPTMPGIADTYGWALVQTGQTQSGLKILESATKAAKGNGDIQFHYAAALARSGDRARAREVLTALLAGNAEVSDRAEAVKLLGQL